MTFVRFAEIKKYLSRLKVWDLDILEEKDNILCFELKNRWTTKYYHIVSKPKHFECKDYPYTYDIHYEQENVGVQHDILATKIGNRSFGSEDYVIKYIRKSLRWYPKG